MVLVFGILSQTRMNAANARTRARKQGRGRVPGSWARDPAPGPPAARGPGPAAEGGWTAFRLPDHELGHHCGRPARPAVDHVHRRCVVAEKPHCPARHVHHEGVDEASDCAQLQTIDVRVALVHRPEPARFLGPAVPTDSRSAIHQRMSLTRAAFRPSSLSFSPSAQRFREGGRHPGS